MRLPVTPRPCFWPLMRLPVTLRALSCPLWSHSSTAPEALATIPTLTLSDLPRANKLIPCEVTSLSDTRVLYHDLFTNGVVYLDVGFDLHILPSELLSYVPLFGRALLETGVGNDDFVRLSQRIGRSTGGIRPQRWTSTVAGGVTSTAWPNLRGKGLADQSVELLLILQDILERARLDNRGRFQQAGAGGDGIAGIAVGGGRVKLCRPAAASQSL